MSEPQQRQKIRYIGQMRTETLNRFHRSGAVGKKLAGIPCAQTAI
jgi:hypothetical protein